MDTAGSPRSGILTPSASDAPAVSAPSDRTVEILDALARSPRNKGCHRVEDQFRAGNVNAREVVKVCGVSLSYVQLIAKALRIQLTHNVPKRDVMLADWVPFRPRTEAEILVDLKAMLEAVDRDWRHSLIAARLKDPI